MSSNVFTKENLNNYLKELAKEYRKLGGKGMPAEIVGEVLLKTEKEITVVM